MSRRAQNERFNDRERTALIDRLSTAVSGRRLDEAILLLELAIQAARERAMLLRPRPTG
jgi:hypothetical protein